MNDDITSILRNYFNLDTDHVSAHYEIILPGRDREKFESIRILYLKHLASHPLREQAAKKLFVGEKIIVHLHHVFSLREVADIKPESVYYYPICTIDEIKRLEEPKTAADYLLKLRADPIAKNARIARIFFARRSKFIGNWSLSEYYDGYEFNNYIEKLPEAASQMCAEVPAGFVLISQPNGACIKTEYGKVIVVSEMLRHFLYYMNVFAHHRNFDLDFEDAVAALFIAIRTMLQTEAPDFDIDPRGDPSGLIHNYCTTVADDQLQFIIGHEFAHLLLGHFDERACLSPADEILTMFPGEGSSEYYTPRQQQEFDADYGGLMHANYSNNERARIMNGATLFFLYLDLFYFVSNYINPSFGGVKTHPDPIARIWTLRRSIISKVDFEADEILSDEDVCDWIDYFEKVKEQLLKNILPYRIDELESYSSTYFPSRGVIEKIDRFDF